MKISTFLSYPKPCLDKQADFIKRINDHLDRRGIAPRTLGVTDYDMEAPMRAIRRLMIQSNGLITVAFRRTYIEKGTIRSRTNIPGLSESPIEGVWLTTPWPHIEAAMAYQLGLPILILRENGVLDDGILERGVVGLCMPEFDLAQPIDEYFASAQWSDLIGRWEGYVRAVVDRKGEPPQLY